MNRRNVLFSILLLPIARQLELLAKPDVVQQFHKKYGSLKTIACTFTSPVAKGSLKAKRGGKYRIELQGRTIICSGSHIFNLQHESKTVVIDNYKPNADDISIERIFFVLLNVYRAEHVANANDTQIKLTPPSTTAMVAGVTEAILHLDSNYLITQIDVAESAARTTWRVGSLRLNQQISDSQFAFKSKPGWQIVDLR